MGDNLECILKETLGTEYDTVVKMLEVIDEETNANTRRNKIRVIIEERADEKSKQEMAP